MIGERDAAQAAVLIRALSDVRDEMISQVSWLEKHDSALDAAALRRDINGAQAHIAGLRRRYLGRLDSGFSACSAGSAISQVGVAPGSRRWASSNWPSCSAAGGLLVADLPVDDDDLAIHFLAAGLR